MLVGITGCEAVVCADGTVTAADTDQALAGVQCTPGDVGEVAFSDAMGRYHVCSGLVGCVPDCPALHVESSKDGYQTVTLKNPRDVALEPEQIPQGATARRISAAAPRR